TEKIPGFEAFKANDEDPATSWRAASADDQWLEAAWVKPRTFRAVTISEVGNHITNYRLQIWKDNSWQDLLTGDTCGPERHHSFDPVTTSKCRLLLSRASKAPEISEFVIGRQ
ncbi:discoidin domain-containing protein, partial [Haloferula rosea]